MLNVMLFVVMLAIAFNMSSQTRSKGTGKGLTPAARETIVEGWQTGDILISLIRAGFTNKIPLGIVLEGDSLCRDSVSGSSHGITIASLIGQVKKGDPNYTAEIRNRALYVHPKAMTASTLNTLELRMPRFTSEPTSAQEIGITLWMQIRGLLVPQDTSMFSGGLQKNVEKLPAITLSNASVHDILDRVITSGNGGAWIMYGVPADWQSNPRTKPYEIFSYSGDQRLADLVNARKENNAAPCTASIHGEEPAVACHAPSVADEIALNGLSGISTPQDSFIVETDGDPDDIAAKLIFRCDSVLREVRLLDGDTASLLFLFNTAQPTSSFTVLRLTSCLAENLQVAFHAPSEQ